MEYQSNLDGLMGFIDRVLPELNYPWPDIAEVIPEPEIKTVYQVEGVTFETYDDAANHVSGIKLHRELNKVFDGSLESIIDKLLTDRQTVINILLGN